MSIYTERLDNIEDEVVMTLDEAYALGLIPHHIHHVDGHGICIKCGNPAVNGEHAP